MTAAACWTKPWSSGCEFGRTVYCQGKLTARTTDAIITHETSPCTAGRHQGRRATRRNRRVFYNGIVDRVHVNATVLHCLGINHEQFSLRYQGLDQRLTGVEPMNVIHKILA